MDSTNVCNLSFSVNKMKKIMDRHIQENFSENEQYKIDDDAVIYATAVIEYITRELLQEAGNLTLPPICDSGYNRIMPSHLQKAVRGDEDMDSLIKSAI